MPLLPMPQIERLARGIDAKLRPRAALASRLARRADAARDARRLTLAAALYREALDLAPRRIGIRIQLGHMLKETGQFGEAERHYLEAVRCQPNSADLAMQMGHFYKVTERPDEAEKSYRRAIALRPGWAEALDELVGLGIGEVASAGTVYDLDRLAPELIPLTEAVEPDAVAQAIRVSRLGARRERSRWGTMKVLRGIEAIRGFCTSTSPIIEIAVMLDGIVIHTMTPKAASTEGGMSKYVFNIWLNFAPFEHGPHQLDLRAYDSIGRVRGWRTTALIAPPQIEADLPDSDALVAPAVADPRPIEEQIRARPSMVRNATRRLLPAAPSAVLVQRVDQLGDMVCSIPAIKRLREIVGGAKLVGLVSRANEGLARSSGLFEALVVIDFPEDLATGRRVMPLEAQERLRQELAAYNFDIAIDLCEGGGSRPLLALSGAPFTFGFKGREFAWLSAGLDCNAHDPANRLEVMSQSQKVLALVEAFGAIFQSKASPHRRNDLDRRLLEHYDIRGNQRFAVLHAGARLVFSRWPHFEALANQLLDRTDLTLLLLADEPMFSAARFGTRADRVRVIEGKLPFDHFDAMLSFADLFVGNDSGPKHMAALRGTPVISLHMARLDWREWGQEGFGRIISRRVPCAGCAISRDGNECGRDFTCIRDISPEEVVGAALDLLAEAASAIPLTGRVSA
ncbi:glycosyltransferase family 9 protein [Sphingomonas nostoxanthinifaciens]|uniref:glycosyltransferase family 9 protein n=1 Tax=Sphingomonas nostoxanthinifaciens TaxID=2872652 RepID=UPI001CC1F3D0|nr:glycosyltransferase family 9 protein [Sphingomonas nostoxanthinifaciens]UAK25001.1 hypothetical protein K8P63_01945 [Sphingomonas nostoxanthinifaciens]